MIQVLVSVVWCDMCVCVLGIKYIRIENLQINLHLVMANKLLAIRNPR